MREHDFEPVPGLPEALPSTERLLWQGSPDARTFANRVFRVRLIGGYFAILAAWRVASTLYDRGSLADIAVQLVVLAVLAAAAMGFFWLFAWLIARSTLYTITSRRVVMRFGVALPMTLNLPFTAIDSASMKPLNDGHGDIPLHVRGKTHPSYVVLWPHARPWRFNDPEPMLRSIPNAEQVADILTAAFAASTDERVVRGEQPAGRPANGGRGSLATAAG